jgi:hypothetical protein
LRGRRLEHTNDIFNTDAHLASYFLDREPSFPLSYGRVTGLLAVDGN